MLAPYVLTFAALWLAGEVVWRVAVALIARVEIRGIEALYIEAMDELLAKDLAFFQDNFAGSLTKRALGYARRFEDVFDVLVVPGDRERSCRWCSSTVVLWRYSPLLIVVLLGDAVDRRWRWWCRCIRRRRQLVDVREAASNVLAGHVADSIANAEAVRAFARERDEARIHAAQRAGLRREDAAVVGLPELPRRHVTSPMYVLTNTLGLIVALAISRGTGGAAWRPCSSRSATTATATRVMWEFNRIYRNLEGALTDAAQFADLLLDPPLGVRCRRAQFRSRRATTASSCATSASGTRRRSRCCSTASRWPIAPGTKLGLVGRSGGGKTTLTRLLLRFADVERGADPRSAASRSTACLSRRCARPSRTCRRIPSMFHRTIADNIRVGRPERHRRRGAPRRARSRTPPSSSRRCRTATRRWSASAA